MGASGSFSIFLQSSELLPVRYTVHVGYRVLPTGRDYIKRLGMISVPSTGPVTLSSLLSVPSPIPSVPDALAQALAAAAAALASAADAGQYASDAKHDADRAETAAGAAAGHAAAMGDAINAAYTLPEDRLSLPATNGAPLDDDLTPGTQTFTDEIRENYAAPPPGVVNAAARATGLIVFDPPSQESTNYVYTDVPWFTHRGSTFRALPVDISATVFNSLVGPCLFEPVATNSWGMLVWRYIGDKPIHSFLQGQMAMRVRTSGTTNDAFHKLILNLRTWDAPHMEAGGQSNGRRFLSTFIGSYQQPVKMTDYEGMNDECLPLTQAVWTAHNAEPDRFVGYDNGYFDEGSGEVLLTTEGGSPVGAEVRTTKWIDVSDIDASERCLAVWVAGKSRRSRMQWKDSNGDVHFYPVMSRDQHCRRVFRLPHGAQEVRFHYSGPGDDVSSIAVKRMRSTPLPLGSIGRGIRWPPG
ncbi:hypothetical protein [Paracoccus denitrificans]|uniref:hypothetical protein n=1 Tax=Paracoccus denitrificans TaxID=266 RepID=UPI0008859839|nr:hypothetical protein [Paracoccus denitrificans]MBB4627907.1 hypothetical protein [Paracoccus denitrificans]MCU7428561.1 hypothetical protein [Paracoccus denitrificans]UPV95404.1 hypothetical protein M0K93_02095 [Paracoccus denitrificans]SDI61317.1 hypothetical protein SAMN04244581_01971 [Paracoccus denitrificans]SFR05785.1 hypothetical protein SAMN04244569_01909 [Paracoccus denitrificans]